MDNLVFVIIGKKNINLTYSSIKFSYYGDVVKANIITANNHSEGLIKAKQSGFKFGLFVYAGSVFTDLEKFLKILNNYPHRGLIGHIVDPKDSNKYFYLDKQCLYLELNKFDTNDFLETKFKSFVPNRSEKNIHGDYTPLWLSPGKVPQEYEYENFGNKLIAKLINQGQIIVNFNQKLRSCKRYLYTDNDIVDYLNSQQDYINLAESQLWLFNNEKFNVYNLHKNLICPGSGLYWILHLIKFELESIDIVDISKTQIAFAKNLFENWDGENYGEFAFEFVKHFNVKHYNLTDTNLSKLERIKLLKKDYFVNTVNALFEQELKYNRLENFQEKWQQRKNTQVNFINDNLLTFHTNKKSDIWVSNILNYKYNYIKDVDAASWTINEYHTKN